MRALSAVVLLGSVLLQGACSRSAQERTPERAAEESIREEDLRRHTEFLADDALEGREAGSAGGHRAAVYIVEQLGKLGWKPGGPGGAWYQPLDGAEPPASTAKNVIAVRPGSDPALREEWVVLGAHYDHVGMGLSGTRGSAGSVHNGADDNASGTSALLEIAEALTLVEARRSVALIWFDAEEKGLVGSRAWCARPTFPTDRIVAMLNLDMVGRNGARDVKVGVERGGAPKYPKLAALLREAEERFQARFDWDYIDEQKLLRRSDHWSFMEKGVPAVFLHGGLHADYHTERDDAERINHGKTALVARIALWVALRAANGEAGLK